MKILATLQRHRATLATRHAWFEPVLSTVSPVLLFFTASSLFFAALGKSPFPLLAQILNGAFGSAYGLTETFVKTTPILLCALATALPARLGLLTVGASGQFYLGAWCGTGLLLLAPPGWSPFLFLPVFAAACAGGAAWSLVPGYLKARLEVNETLSTLLLNYVASLLVESAATMGVDSRRVKWLAILAGGAFSGLGGAALSVDQVRNWIEWMTAGRGLVAVGLVIVARWNPWLALPAALLFGVVEALTLRMQTWGVPVSSYLLSTFPYLVCLAVLVWGYVRARTRGGMPRDLAQAFARTE